MKKATLTPSLLALFIVFLLSSQSVFSQSGRDTSLLSKFDFALVLQGGATFKSHNALSQLLYRNDGTLNTGIYYNSGFGIMVRIGKLCEIVQAQRTTITIKPVNGGEIEVSDNYVSVGLGYMLAPRSKIRVIPNLGVVFSESEIMHQPRPGFTQNTTTYLSGRADVYRLKGERYYAKVGLLASYAIDGPNLTTFFPLDIGLNLEFAQAFTQTNWRRGIDTEIDGPNIFDNTFYAGLTLAWWL